MVNDVEKIKLTISKGKFKIVYQGGGKATLKGWFANEDMFKFYLKLGAFLKENRQPLVTIQKATDEEFKVLEQHTKGWGVVVDAREKEPKI